MRNNDADYHLNESIFSAKKPKQVENLSRYKPRKVFSVAGKRQPNISINQDSSTLSSQENIHFGLGQQ